MAPCITARTLVSLSHPIQIPSCFTACIATKIHISAVKTVQLKYQTRVNECAAICTQSPKVRVQMSIAGADDINAGHVGKRALTETNSYADVCEFRKCCHNSEEAQSRPNTGKYVTVRANTSGPLRGTPSSNPDHDVSRQKCLNINLSTFPHLSRTFRSITVQKLFISMVGCPSPTVNILRVTLDLLSSSALYTSSAFFRAKLSTHDKAATSWSKTAWSPCSKRSSTAGSMIPQVYKCVLYPTNQSN